MTPEQLMALASARGVNLEALSRGGTPDWTSEDVALAAAGLDRICFAAALFSLAGDDGMWSRLRTYLLEYLLAERERMQWTRWVERDGFRSHFAEDVVELVLIEERSPGRFQVAPELLANAHRVETENWRRVNWPQWACVMGEYRRKLLDAEEHVRRKLRQG